MHFLLLLGGGRVDKWKRMICGRFGGLQADIKKVE
jgi:hypothetical protein